MKQSIWTFWFWTRKYLVATVLIAMLVLSFVQVFTIGTPPTPQGPPLGFELMSLEADLEWHPGTRKGEAVLQVSKGDPEFEEPFIDKEMKGTHYALKELEPGNVYYWRVKKGDTLSPTSWFEVSKYAVDF